MQFWPVRSSAYAGSGMRPEKKLINIIDATALAPSIARGPFY